MKKYIKLGILTCCLVMAGVFLAGCGEQRLNVNDDISTSLAAVGEYFDENVYSSPQATDFNTNTSPNHITNENYYVLIATEVTQTIPKIKLNSIVYTSGTDFSLAVGNSNLVTRTPFRIDEGDFYISAPLLFLNAGTDGIVTVSFPEQKIKPFEITVFEESNLKIEVTSPAEGVLFAISNTINQFNFKSNNPTNSIFIVLKDGENVLSSSEVVLIEKVANAGLTNQSVAYSYSNPTTPSGETENGIQFFPGYNGGVNYTETTPADHKLIYNIFVSGVGSATIIINFENTFVAP